jgi:hypothetical protein
MLKTRLIAAASAVALSLAALSAPAFAATTMKHPRPPIHHVVKKPVHHVYVSGKIVKIDRAASLIKLSNGKTYRVTAKVIGKFRVGEHIRLRIK